MSPGMLNASSLIWAAYRLVRKSTYSIIPIEGHLQIARLRGWMRRSKYSARVYRNLERTFGADLSAEKLEEIARDHEKFYSRLYLARLLPHLPGFHDPRRWPVEGLEHLSLALEENRGAILTTAHFGYARLIDPVLRLHDYDVLPVVAAMSQRLEKQARYEKWLERVGRFKRYIHESTRVLTKYMRSSEVLAGLDVRPIFEALSNNRPVLLVGDGVRAAKFARLELLGQPYPFPTGFMKIAMVSGAPVLPVFAVEGQFPDMIRIEIHPPLSLDPEATVEDNLREYAGVLDRQIRKTPHLWSRWRIESYFERAEEWTTKDLDNRYSGSFIR